MADYATSTYELTKLSESIIKIHSFEPRGINLKEAKEVTELIYKLIDGDKFAVLRSTSENFFSTDRVRALIASKQISENRYAMAFVVNSTANKISAEFYLQFNKPTTITKIFEDENKALEWLKEQEEIYFSNNK